MMKNFKKVIVALVISIAFAYAWQLFFVFVCFKYSEGFIITQDMFIPSIDIQLVFLPFVAWTVMGLLKVLRIKKWVGITINFLSFFIPFTLISVGTTFVAPSLWDKPIYWVANIGISMLASIKIKNSDDVESTLSAVNEKY